MRRVLLVCAVMGALGATALAEPVLEWAPTVGGPWQADTKALIRELPGGDFEVWTPTEADSLPFRQRFYRLIDPEAGRARPTRCRR